MKCLLVQVLALFWIGLFSTSAIAGSWFVELDGSGDFSLIQDAVYEAASGDTIHIGPGRFDEVVQDPCIPDPRYNYRVIQTQRVLTLIGSGSSSDNQGENTIIGPEILPDPDGWQFGLASYGMCGGEVLNVKSIRFENLNGAIHSGETSELSTENCVFVNNDTSIETDVLTLRISDTNFFEGNRTNRGVATFSRPEPQDHLIQKCSFIQGGSSSGYGISGAGNGSLHVGECEFLGGNPADGDIGVGAIYHPVSINDCQFENLNWSVMFAGGHYRVGGSGFSNVNFGLYDLGGSSFIVEAENCIFERIKQASVSYQTLYGGGHVRNCSLGRGRQFVVASSYNRSELGDSQAHLIIWGESRLLGIPSIPIDLVSMDLLSLPQMESWSLDMSNNWWETTNSDSIQAWIEDGEDIPEFPFYIDWYPFRDEPLEAEKAQFGSVKALYRGKN